MYTKQYSPVVLSIAVALGITGCGGSSSNETVSQVNVSPTNIELSSNTVNENETGVVIGTLSAIDADQGDTFTYTTSTAGYVISGNTLSLASDMSFDFEVTGDTPQEVSITVVDSASNSFSKTLNIVVSDVLDYYSFPSRIEAGVDSVAYSGQVARHVLINELNLFINTYLGNVASFNSNGEFNPQSDEETVKETVLTALNSYYLVSDYAALSERTLMTTGSLPLLQTTLSQISPSSKNLISKIAGNDVKSQHKDWSTEFAGWGETGSTTPDGLLNYFFDELAANALALSNGDLRQDPFGNSLTKVYLSEDGVDYKQMVQKFLLMSVAFSQGADDYLDLDESDPDSSSKGVFASNTQDGTKPYTKLEHQIDEGFGYFGASRDYLTLGDAAVKSSVISDTNGDETIDLTSEYNFGQSVNAAKRDIGSDDTYDFSGKAINHFLNARKLASELAINHGTEPTIEERRAIFAQTKLATEAWEGAIVATVIHYINDTIADLNSIGTNEFDYETLAKHWSEMKAFGLGLQFNRHSLLSDEKFAQVHNLMGVKPVLTGDVEGYQADLLEARSILKDAYEFSDAIVASW